MKKRNIAFVLPFFNVYLLMFVFVTTNFCFITLDSLPWIDEVFFAELSRSYINDNDVRNEFLLHFTKNKELHTATYGPFFFWFKGVFFDVFGYSILVSRTFNFIIATVFIFVFYKLLELLIKDRWVVFGICLFFIFDPFFNLSVAGNRMEIFGLSFSVFTWYLFSLKNKSNIILFFTGLMTSIALLSTPRLAVFLLPLYLYHFVEVCRNKYSWSSIFWLSFPILTVVYTYIYLYFGSLRSYLEVILFLNDFFGNQEFYFYVPKHEYLLIFIIVIFLSYFLVTRNKKILMKVLIPFFQLALFYFFIKDFGLYSMCILPCYYIMLAYFSKEILKCKTMSYD